MVAAVGGSAAPHSCVVDSPLPWLMSLGRSALPPTARPCDPLDNANPPVRYFPATASSTGRGTDWRKRPTGSAWPCTASIRVGSSPPYVSCSRRRRNERLGKAGRHSNRSPARMGGLCRCDGRQGFCGAFGRPDGRRDLGWGRSGHSLHRNQPRGRRQDAYRQHLSLGHRLCTLTERHEKPRVAHRVSRRAHCDQGRLGGRQGMGAKNRPVVRQLRRLRLPLERREKSLRPWRRLPNVLRFAPLGWKSPTGRSAPCSPISN